MKYLSGEEIKRNDNVLIESRHTPATVEHIIEAKNDMKEWNLNEKGVLLKSLPFGLVFWPIDYKSDPLIFVSRSNI